MTPSYALGLFFIFLVSIIWSAASIVVQHLYRDMDFDSPFLLTFVSTSLFVLFLPTRLIWERRKRFGRWIRWMSCALALRRGNGAQDYSAVGTDEDGGHEGTGSQADNEDIIPWKNYREVDSASPDELPLTSNHGTALASTRRNTNAASGGVEMESRTEDSAAGLKSVYRAVDPSAGNGEGASNRGEVRNTASEETHMDIHANTDGCHGESRESEASDDGIELPTKQDLKSTDTDELVEFFKKDERGFHGLHTAETSLSTASAETDVPVSTRAPPSHLLSHVDHISMALRIAPVWFLSNYFYNTSLAYTSISSSTVLASTGSLFTFLFAVTCGDERITVSKLAGVALCFAGSVLTGLSDAEAAMDDGGIGLGLANVTDPVMPTASLEDAAVEDSASFFSASTQDAEYGGLQLWGDLAGLISAIGYGTYTVLIRTLCPKDESRMSMQLLLGYIGGINGLVLLPIALKMVFFDSCPLSDGESPAGAIDHADQSSDGASGSSPDSASPCEQLTLVVVAYLLAKAFFDNVLSDYLWARAVILTSATVATVGLGLTIPLAFLSDWFMGHDDVASVQSVAGALAVLFGFIFVNCGEGGGDGDDDKNGHSVEVVS